MRAAVLGGTQFIGRAIVEKFVTSGDEVLVVHRGKTEPADFPEVEHLHCDRRDLPNQRTVLADFGPEFIIDTRALSRADADAALEAIPPDAQPMVLSSADVYRAFTGLNSGVALEPVPIYEESPVRDQRFPFRGQLDGMQDYEKLDVEEAYSARGAVVFRLPFVFGERDYQRREDFVLRRIRAGRSRVPFGAGNFLGSRAYVGDVATAVKLATDSPGAAGEIFNLAEPATLSVRQLAEGIVEVSGRELELVSVPDDLLPPDLGITGALKQHFVLDSSKARQLLGWECGDSTDLLRRTVEWHLSNPPTDEDRDFSADDAALAAA